MSPEDILNNFNGKKINFKFKVSVCVILEDDPIHKDFFLLYFNKVHLRQ